MTPIPVVYVMPQLYREAGTERHILEVLTHLDRRAFSPILCCLRARGTLLEYVRGLQVPIIDGRVETFRGAGIPRAVVRLGRELRKLRPLVVHSYLFHGNLIGTLAARMARVPVTLASKRSLDQYANPLERLASRIPNSLADRVTANAPLAVQAAKRAINGTYYGDMRAWLDWETAQASGPLLSEDRKAGLAAAAQRTRADFKGK